MCGCGRCDACARLAYFDRPKKGNTMKARDLNQSHVGKSFKEVVGRVRYIHHMDGLVRVLSDAKQTGWHLFNPDDTLELEPEYETLAVGELRPEHIGRKTEDGWNIYTITFYPTEVMVMSRSGSYQRFQYNNVIHLRVGD